jgi:hypothetical protein
MRVSSRVLCLATFVVLNLVGPARMVAAQTGDGGGSSNPFGDVAAVDETSGGETGGGDGGGDAGGVDWSCTYRPSSPSRTIPYSDGEYDHAFYDGMHWRHKPSTGETWLRMYESCTAPGQTARTRTFWELQGDPDPRVLIEPARKLVTEKVFAPQPLMSPSGNRGVVNLGMWLAVVDQGQVSAIARASDVTWARATATLRTTRFQFGNGDAVTCDGAGTPIPEWAKDSVEQGGCGYTYRSLNDGGEPYTITITSTWTVVATTSRSAEEVPLDDIVLTTIVPYDIIEIQTVGVSG